MAAVAAKLLEMVTMIPIALLGGFSAHACDEARADVLAVSPEVGARGVPRDARVVLQVRGTPDTELGVRVVDWYGEEVPGVWEAEWTGEGRGVTTFHPDAPFEPFTHYSVVLDEGPANVDGYPTWGTDFVTGPGFVEPLTVGASIQILDAGQVVDGLENRCEPEQFRRVSVQVEPGPASRPSEGWVFLYLVGEGDDVLLDSRRLDGRNWDDPMDVRVPTASSEVCLVAAQRNAAGEERLSVACYEDSPIPEEQTIAYYGGGSCTGGGCRTVSPVFGLWVLVPLWMRRRS